MYEKIDANIERLGASCMSGCPHPLNHTGICYLRCFAGVVAETPVKVLIEPWIEAFGGSCPEVPFN